MGHETIGKRVAKRRREMSMTQMELAVNCECSMSTIAGIEQDENDGVSQRVLEKLSSVLGISIDELVKGVKPARKA